MMTDTSENVLTPDFARSAVRFATLRTGSVVFDEDLVQDALLRGLKAFRRTAHVKYPRAFFTKIVLDTVRDHWRRRRVVISLDSLSTDEPGEIPDLEEKIDRDKRLRRVFEALKALSPHNRALIELFYLEELPLARLSVILGKSHSALKMALLRSRNEIKRSVTGNAVDNK